MLFNFQLIKSSLPPEWSSDGHVLLSLPNLLSAFSFWSVLSLAYHLINSPFRHLLLITCAIIIFLDFFYIGWGRGMCIFMRVGGIKVWVIAKLRIWGGGGGYVLEYRVGWMKVCVAAKLSLSESKREFLCNIVWVSSSKYMTFGVYEWVSKCAYMWSCEYEI